MRPPSFNHCWEGIRSRRKYSQANAMPESNGKLSERKSRGGGHALAAVEEATSSLAWIVYCCCYLHIRSVVRQYWSNAFFLGKGLRGLRHFYPQARTVCRREKRKSPERNHRHVWKAFPRRVERSLRPVPRQRRRERIRQWGGRRRFFRHPRQHQSAARDLRQQRFGRGGLGRRRVNSRPTIALRSLIGRVRGWILCERVRNAIRFRDLTQTRHAFNVAESRKPNSQLCSINCCNILKFPLLLLFHWNGLYVKVKGDC